jgi:hypothetical protein
LEFDRIEQRVTLMQGKSEQKAERKIKNGNQQKQSAVSIQHSARATVWYCFNWHLSQPGCRKQGSQKSGVRRRTKNGKPTPSQDFKGFS